MKKLLLILFTLLMFIGCSDSSKTSSTEIQTNDISENKVVIESKTETAVKKQFDAEEIFKHINIAEYKYKSYFSYYHFLEVTNNSDSTINIELNILYYDSDNNLIGAESCSEEVIESGYSVLLYTMPDEDFERTEIELAIAEPRYYSPIQSDIELKISPAKNKLVIQATNNGDEPANFVEVHVLFFDGDKVVGHGYSYFDDDNSKLDPGRTISKNIDNYEYFDSYKYYVTGRRSK